LVRIDVLPGRVRGDDLRRLLLCFLLGAVQRVVFRDARIGADFELEPPTRPAAPGEVALHDRCSPRAAFMARFTSSSIRSRLELLSKIQAMLSTLGSNHAALPSAPRTCV